MTKKLITENIFFIITVIDRVKDENRFIAAIATR